MPVQRKGIAELIQKWKIQFLFLPVVQFNHLDYSNVKWLITIQSEEESLELLCHFHYDFGRLNFSFST